MKQRWVFHWSALIRSFILLGFAYLLGGLISTGELTLYLHPRFNRFIEWTIYLFAFLAFVQMLQIFGISHYREDGHFHGGQFYTNSFFVIILTAMFLIPSNTLDSRAADNKGFNDRLTVNATANVTSNDRPLAKQLQKEPIIKITDLNFPDLIEEINQHPQDYVGKKVTMIGYVFKEPGLTNTQFALVRYVVTCCIADASPYGFLCETANADQYNEGAWLSINGIIQLGQYQGQAVPVLKFTTTSPIPQPQRPYIYPAM